MTLGLLPRHALLNDANPHLINFYRWLKRGLVIDLDMVNDERLYYAHRTRFNTLVEAGDSGGEEAASLFYYLNRTGYNGLCRFNQSGLFNVPFGRYATINYTYDFLPYRALLARWSLATGDFSNLDLDSDDLVYADPPYDVEFTQYAEGGFGWDDQVRAAELLAAHPGPVVLSNQATPRIVKLYKKLGFELQFLSAPRRISCTGDRAPAQEVLATKNI